MTPPFEKFVLAAKTDQEYDFFIAHSNCSEQFLGKKGEALAIFRRFDESPVIWESKSKDNKNQGKEVLSWLIINSWPVVLNITEETISKFFDQKKDFLVLFDVKQTSDFTSKRYREVYYNYAKEMKGQILFT